MIRLRLRLFLVLVTALAVAASGPVVEMAAGAPADASKKKKKRSCAKKKKKRGKRSASDAKKRKRAKCKKKKRRGTTPKADANAVAQAYVNGSQFYRPFASQYSNGEETWRFCNNGRFFYRYTTSGTYTTSEEYGSGTWRLEKGEYVQSGGKQGVAGLVRLDGTVRGTTVNDQSQNNAVKFVYAFDNEQQAGVDAGNGFQEFQRTRTTDAC